MEFLQPFDHELMELRSTIERGLHLGVDRLFLIEDEYSLAMLAARLTWLRQLIREINDETLTEKIDGQLKWKIHHADLSLMQDEKVMEHHEPDNVSG
jgi:hypothetical protein